MGQSVPALRGVSDRSPSALLSLHASSDILCSPCLQQQAVRSGPLQHAVRRQTTTVSAETVLARELCGAHILRGHQCSLCPAAGCDRAERAKCMRRWPLLLWRPSRRCQRPRWRQVALRWRQVARQAALVPQCSRLWAAPPLRPPAVRWGTTGIHMALACCWVGWLSLQLSERHVEERCRCNQCSYGLHTCFYWLLFLIQGVPCRVM